MQIFFAKLIKSASKVVFDCASCKSAILDYPELSRNEKNKLIFFDEILDKQYKLKSKSKYRKITFHKPCHMNRYDFAKIETSNDIMTGSSFVGVVAGLARGTDFNNISVSGDLTGYEGVGGLAGKLDDNDSI